MKTELEIVYNILETVTAGHVTIDYPLNERLVRSYLREFRADSIRKNYLNGHTVPEFLFQDKNIVLNAFLNTSIPNTHHIENPHHLEGTYEYTFKMPKIIHLDHNYGAYFYFMGEQVSLYSDYEYNLNKKNFYNNNKPMCSIVSSEKGKIYLPGNYANLITRQKIKSITLRAILADPDEGSGYDWRSSQYPFPEERLPELTNSILARKFGIILNAKPDEVINARKDEILYHENHNLSNG